MDIPYLVVMLGRAVLFRKVVDRKQMKASPANTLVPKLKMSFPRNTAAFKDPEDKKSLIAFSSFVRGFSLLSFLPMFL